MPIRAVIFDIGGVILHTRNYDRRRAWEERLGLSQGQLGQIVFGSEAAARAASGEVLEGEVWREVGRTLELRDDQLAGLQRDFWADEQLDLELAQFIQSLRPRIKIAIITNAWSDARSIHNSRFQLNAWTDVAVYSAEVRLVKPDARIYQLALSQLGVRADECVFVDDVLVNVQAAQALSMKGVQYRDTPQAIAEIQGYLE